MYVVVDAAAKIVSLIIRICLLVKKGSLGTRVNHVRTLSFFAVVSDDESLLFVGRQTTVIQQIVRQYGIPQVVALVTSDTFSDKATYPVSIQIKISNVQPPNGWSISLINGLCRWF
jgi:hypothetical protein